MLYSVQCTASTLYNCISLNIFKHSDKFNFPLNTEDKRKYISLMRTETARSSNKEKPARWRTGCTNRTHNLSASPSKPLTAAITSLAHSHSVAPQLPAHPSLVFPANLRDRVTWPPSCPSVGPCWPPGDLPAWGCMANRGLEKSSLICKPRGYSFDLRP